MRPEDLTGPELRLWEAFGTGEEVDLGPADAAGGDSAADGESWGPERTVRASVIRSLVLGGADEVRGETATLDTLLRPLDDAEDSRGNVAPGRRTVLVPGPLSMITAIVHDGPPICGRPHQCGRCAGAAQPGVSAGGSVTWSMASRSAWREVMPSFR